MNWLASVSVRRPTFATVLMALVVVFGLVGYSRLGVDRFPKVDFPTVAVITRLPGAAPKEVESDVTMKLEEAVNTIGGIDELRSTSDEGVSQIFVTFVLEKDIEVAAQEVRDRVSSAVGNLPVGTEAPSVLKMDPDATPVLYLAVRANAAASEVREVADKVVKRRLESTNGVGQVNLVGGAGRAINVWLDAARLRAHDVTSLDVKRAIQSSNATIPGGRLEAGPEQQVLRVRARAETPEELGSLVVVERPNAPVYVRDVARVEDGVEEPDTAASRDGVPAVVLSLRKQSGANSVAVVDEVRARLAELGPELPAGYAVEVVRDNTATIRTSVHAVTEHLILGAIFAGLVVLLFLGNLRSTLIAALAIPISIVGTFALMWTQGFSLDTITLLALALAVGIVIDDAIVVLENVHRTMEEQGVSAIKGAVLATREVGLAVLATTLSLVAVFLPVAFMSGIVGRFMKSFGVTMAFAIVVSMLVSFTLTPMLSSRWLKAHRPHADGTKHKTLLERVTDRINEPLERAYERVLGWVMRRRWVVVVLSVLTLLASVPLLGVVPKGFLPKNDYAEFNINVRAPEGTSLDATLLAADRVAREVRRTPNVKMTLVTIGDNDQKTPNLASIYVKLTDPEQRKQTQDQLMAVVRRDVIAHQPKSLAIDVSEVPLFSGGMKDAPVSYQITGPDLAELERHARDLMLKMRQIPGAVDVDSSLVSGKPETSLRIDRERAADRGVKVADIATTLSLYVGGTEVSRYQENGETYPIELRGEATSRTEFERLSLLAVPSQHGPSVPVSELVRPEKDTGPASITRLNRRRQVVVYSNLAVGAAQGTVMAGVEKAVRELKLPAGYQVAPAGQSKEMGRTGQAFMAAFGMSFVFMYLVLAAQFESWLHPITILLALPLTLPFALVSLLLFGQALDIYSMLGLLVLFGVVKKNAILQIDHTNQLRARGMERDRAIIQANRDRLRPILMTTLAFVAGMIPLILSSGIGAGYNRATAGVIVGGQTLSLLLTLVATPVAYSLFDDASAWLKRKLGRGDDAALRRELAELDELDLRPTPAVASTS